MISVRYTYTSGGTVNGGVGNDTLEVDYTSYGYRVANNYYYNDYRFYTPNIGFLLIYSNFEQFNLTGTEFNDTLQGFGNDDTLNGGAGNDALYGNGGKDLVQGGTGNDTVYGGNIGDTLDGGEGSDYLADFSAAAETANITVNSTASNNVSVGETQITNFEGLGNITTGSGNDSFKFADYTLGGNFNGNGGKDSLTSNYSGYGQAINTTSSALKNAANGANLLNYSNIEQFDLTGTNFNDTIDGLGNVGNTLDGGGGNDYLANFNAASQTEDITIDFTNSKNIEFGNTKITNFEAVGNVTTGSGNDLFKLGAYTSGGTVNGGVGNDTLEVDYTSYGYRVANIESIANAITGSGNDSFIYSSASSVSGGNVNGNLGNDTLSVDFSGYQGKVGNTYYGDRFALNNNGTYLLSYSNIEQFKITGTDFNDSLQGSNGNDTIDGGKGNDFLLGQAGNDTINGNAGNDYIDSGTGIDSVVGGEGNDTFVGVNSGDIIDGGEGIDFLQSLNASEATNNITIDSNSSIDIVYGNTSIVTSVTNIESIGNVTTGSGNDRFVYNQADSVAGKSINANAGNDLLSVDFSAYQGAVGNTRYSSVFLLNNISTSLLNYYNIEQFKITGSDFNDSLAGGIGSDTIAAGAGNDSLVSGTGNDSLDGGEGNDFIDSGTGNDSVIGSAGNDTIDGGNTGDLIDGGTGNDSLQTFNASDATVDLNIDSNNPINLEYGNTSITNIESIGNATTGSGNDRFVYNSASSTSGKSVNGNSGNDLLSVDFSAYQGAVGNTRYSSVFLLNNISTSLLNYYNIEQFKITGSDFNDSLAGGIGSDTIAAGAGNDSLVGNTGNDSLDGGEGNDTLSGGSGNDSLVFDRLGEGIDTITDFSVNNDLLVFSTTFDAGLVAGSVTSQMFLIGTAATSNEHRFIYNAGSGDLFYDSDGIGTNEQLKIASLGTNLSLTNNNFHVAL